MIFTYWGHSMVPRLMRFNCFSLVIAQPTICGFYTHSWANVLSNPNHQCYVDKKNWICINSYETIESNKVGFDTTYVNVDSSSTDIKQLVSE
jgi:hypothetical protein